VPSAARSFEGSLRRNRGCIAGARRAGAGSAESYDVEFSVHNGADDEVAIEMRKPSARGKITRELVMDAALALADRDGFDGVTLRAIAADLGATPMALYTYFSNKDALYEGMRDRVFGRVADETTSRRTWRAVLEGIARGVYRTMREHPNWKPLLTHESGPPPSGLGLIDKLLELMLKDGFSVEDAMRAYGCLMSFAVGSVLFEGIMMGGGDVVTKRLALLKELVGRSPGRYASLAAVAAKVERWRSDDVFELGIRSLLGGIEDSRARSRRPGRPQARATRRRA
jgi:AcrR family transcriptional regulator